MRVMKVEPGEAPYMKDIPSGLKSLQKEVDGDIEALFPFDEPVALICNEEGKDEHLPWNRCLRDEDGEIYDVIAGSFLIVGLQEENFGSLSPENEKQFMERFKAPEQFVEIGDKIVELKRAAEDETLTAAMGGTNATKYYVTSYTVDRRGYPTGDEFTDMVTEDLQEAKNHRDFLLRCDHDNGQYKNTIREIRVYQEDIEREDCENFDYDVVEEDEDDNLERDEEHKR